MVDIKGVIKHLLKLQPNSVGMECQMLFAKMFRPALYAKWRNGEMAKWRNHKPYGKMQPLNVPSRPAEALSIDFITDLPKSRNFDSILVIVDRISKGLTVVPCDKTVTASELKDLMIKQVFWVKGKPKNILSDCGPQLRAKTWQGYCASLGVDLSFTAGYIQATDQWSNREDEPKSQEIFKMLLLEVRRHLG